MHVHEDPGPRPEVHRRKPGLPSFEYAAEAGVLKPARALTPKHILQLQRLGGNAAVYELLSKSRDETPESDRLTRGREIAASSSGEWVRTESSTPDWPDTPKLAPAQLAAPITERRPASAFLRDGGAGQGAEKAVEGGEGGNTVDGVVVEKDGDELPTRDEGESLTGNDPAVPAQAGAKTVGVDSFVVTWAARSTDTQPGLRLDYAAKFKKDATHDPALAEFRQSVMTKLAVTAGPNKGMKADTSPMHDDNYSRADDTGGHKLADEDFASNDNPGVPNLDKNDVVDYSFTAEQTIIDTSQGNKSVAKRGPHTGTVKGKHPRTSGGVPKTLS